MNCTTQKSISRKLNMEVKLAPFRYSWRLLSHILSKFDSPWSSGLILTDLEFDIRDRAEEGVIR